MRASKTASCKMANQCERESCLLMLLPKKVFDLFFTAFLQFFDNFLQGFCESKLSNSTFVKKLSNTNIKIPALATAWPAFLSNVAGIL